MKRALGTKENINFRKIGNLHQTNKALSYGQYHLFIQNDGCFSERVHLCSDEYCWQTIVKGPLFWNVTCNRIFIGEISVIPALV